MMVMKEEEKILLNFKGFFFHNTQLMELKKKLNRNRACWLKKVISCLICWLDAISPTTQIYCDLLNATINLLYSFFFSTSIYFLFVKIQKRLACIKANDENVGWMKSYFFGYNFLLLLQVHLLSPFEISWLCGGIWVRLKVLVVTKMCYNIFVWAESFRFPRVFLFKEQRSIKSSRINLF